MYSILNGNMLMLVNLKLEQMANSLRVLSSSNSSGTVNPWDSHVQEPAMWETRASWDQLLGRSMDVLHIVWIYSPRRLQPWSAGKQERDQANHAVHVCWVQCTYGVLVRHCSLPVLIHVASHMCIFFVHPYVSTGNMWSALHFLNLTTWVQQLYICKATRFRNLTWSFKGTILPVAEGQKVFQEENLYGDKHPFSKLNVSNFLLLLQNYGKSQKLFLQLILTREQ